MDAKVRRRPGWFQKETTKELWRWDGRLLMCLVNGVWVDYGWDDTEECWCSLKKIGPLKALSLGATRTEVLNLVNGVWVDYGWDDTEECWCSDKNTSS